MQRAAALLALLIFATAATGTNAAQRNTVDRTTDYFIAVETAQVFIATTDLCDDSDELWCWGSGYFTDSMLWLYSADGTLLGLSDDDGISYASHLELHLEPGVYRLRAGRCCGNPEAEFPSGGHYTLMTTLDAILDPEPPQLSPAPIPSELPTPTPSPTEEPTPTPTPTPEPTPVETPTPEPTLTPEPTPEPTPTPSPIETATPEPTPEPTAQPTPTPTPTPTETPTPTPTETLTPEPTATATPQEPTPSPSETPTEPPAPVENPVQAVAAAVEFIANLGADLTPEERETARATIIPAVVITQVAAAATAAAAASGGSATGGGGRKGKR